MTPVKVENDLCKGCGLCIEFCPRHCMELAPELNAKGYHPARLHDESQCTSCSLCAEMCPETCIRVYRKRRKPSD